MLPIAVTISSEEKEEEKKTTRTKNYIDNSVCFDPVCAIYVLFD